MLSEKLVRLPELAAALDRSEDWVKRKWLKLHLEAGMPRKIAVGWSWPRAAMERWLEEGADGAARTVAPAPPPAGALTALIANQNSRLRERYAGRGA